LGKQAVALLESMGYRNLRYYIGGMAEWVESGSPVEKLEPETAMLRTGQTVQPPISHKSSWTGFLDLLAGWPLERLVGFWLGMIVVFGVVYWVAGIGIGWGLQAGNVAVKPDLEGLGTAIYFSFVTALSIGYGDVVPVGWARVLAIVEGAIGLLVFGSVVSKLVSRHQEELVDETHRIAFEARLGRVRTNLHLVLSDLQTIESLCSEPGMRPERIQPRLESAVAIFDGELRAIHDLLYRPQQMPEEKLLESILANLAASLQELGDLLLCMPPGHRASVTLRSNLGSLRTLANEICGECVPRAYAPDLKAWMDRIQEQGRRLEPRA
jgi:potassium channel LctB